MGTRTRSVAMVFLTAGSITATACGRGRSTAAESNGAPATNSAAPVTTATATRADTMTARHHSVLGGAAAGAVAGHMLGHHAIAGAAAGALIQHERNKHARNRQ